MRVNTGHGWTDLGPGSAKGITGHRSAHMVALEEPRSPGMAAASTPGQCPVCGDRSTPGRVYCSTAHQRIGYNRR